MLLKEKKKTILFVERKDSIRQIADALREAVRMSSINKSIKTVRVCDLLCLTQGVKHRTLHGGMQQNDRERAMDDFKNDFCQILGQ